MTKLTGRIKREVTDVTGNPYTIEIAAEGVYIREKGSRTTYGPVGWSLIYLKGGEMKARQHRSEQDTNRKIRRVTRNLLSGV